MTLPSLALRSVLSVRQPCSSALSPEYPTLREKVVDLLLKCARRLTKNDSECICLHGMVSVINAPTATDTPGASQFPIRKNPCRSVIVTANHSAAAAAAWRRIALMQRQ